VYYLFLSLSPAFSSHVLTFNLSISPLEARPPGERNYFNLIGQRKFPQTQNNRTQLVHITASSILFPPPSGHFLTVEITPHTIRSRKRSALHRNIIPRIRNLILAIRIRKRLARGPREGQRAAHGAETGETGVLEAVAFAGGGVAAQGSLAVGAPEVGYALAAGVVAGAASFEGVALFEWGGVVIVWGGGWVRESQDG
jgi:hypothetical protein